MATRPFSLPGKQWLIWNSSLSLFHIGKLAGIPRSCVIADIPLSISSQNISACHSSCSFEITENWRSFLCVMARWRRDSTVNKVTRDGSGESAGTGGTLISDGLWSGLWVKEREAKAENRNRKMNSDEKTWRERRKGQTLNIKGEVMGKDLQDCLSSVGQTKRTLRHTWMNLNGWKKIWMKWEPQGMSGHPETSKQLLLRLSSLEWAAQNECDRIPSSSSSSKKNIYIV